MKEHDRSLQLLYFFTGYTIIIKKYHIQEVSMKKRLSMLAAVILVVLVSLFGAPGGEETAAIPAESIQSAQVMEDGSTLIYADGVYTTKEDVSQYIHTYGCLPENFMTKAEARKLGWEGGGLEDYAPGMCIGGDHFGNYEGLLPDDRDYTECDIDTLGKDSRGAKRIVFSDDGLIYYTEDHYESFELLYGEP